jgi:hypothetical protein
MQATTLILIALCALVGTATAEPVSFRLRKAEHLRSAPRTHPKLREARRAAGKDDKLLGASNGKVNLPLGGDVWPVAIYWTEVSVGTPPRKFPVAVDSGSYTLDIPSSGCKGCVTTAPNNNYDFKASSTGSYVPCKFGPCANPFSCSAATGACGFSNSYQTCDLSNPDAVCTIAGSFNTDAVSLGSAGPVNVTFGTIETQTTNFDQFKVIDGVMGVAGPAGNQNVFSSLFDAGHFDENVLAMCFVAGSKANGTITFGGTDEKYYHGEIKYTANVGGSMYEMKLNDIKVAGKSISDFSTRGAILDSGTNVLLLPDAVYKSYTSLLSQSCSTKSLHGICDIAAGEKSLLNGGCFDFTDEQVAAFPIVTLELEGVTLEIHGDDYLNLGRRHESGKRCFGMRNTGVGGFLIIGDTIMERYYVVFNRAKHAIGWAPVNKETCGSEL